MPLTVSSYARGKRLELLEASLTREVVVFDTNVYRAIGAPGIVQIRDAERAQGVGALASQHVAIELMARLVGLEEGDRKRAMSALRALTSHSAMSRDGRRMVPFVQCPLKRLFLSAFNADREEALVRWLSFALADSFGWEGQAFDAGFLQACQLAAELVGARESRYAKAHADAAGEAMSLMKGACSVSDERARQLAAAHIHKNCPDFAAGFLAMHIVDQKGGDAQNDDLAPHVARIKSEAPVVAYFANRQFERSASGEIDPRKSKYSNGVWDMQFSALIHPQARMGEGSLFHNASLVVVTMDREIRRAAADGGAGERVRSLREHCTEIGLSDLAERRGWV